jgi:excinuclease ABC subunit A
VAIEQRAPAMSSRSTVGTATEIYDYLRLLWARVGEPTCVRCGSAVVRDTPQSAADALIHRGGRVQVAFPLPRISRASRDAVIDNLRALGFVRIELAGTVHRLDELPADLVIDENTDLTVIVDRLSAEPAMAGRLAEAVAMAFAEGEGIALALLDGGVRERFTLRHGDFNFLCVSVSPRFKIYCYGMKMLND